MNLENLTSEWMCNVEDRRIKFIHLSKSDCNKFPLVSYCLPYFHMLREGATV